MQGDHQPVALPFLITEGVLPQDPSSDLFKWANYTHDEGFGDITDQLLWTPTCVVWSQGRFVRNVYRFDLEGENVVAAVLTSFPRAGQLESEVQEQPSLRKLDPSKSSIHQSREQPKPSGERALAVLLKSKVHIYFVNGSSHIVDLPFKAAAIFAAPRGVLLQRSASETPSFPPTPQLPAAPPNSFFSSQLQASSSYLQSPTLVKSFASSQSNRASPLSGKSRLGTLLQDVLGSASKESEEDIASVYSLTSPLSDVGIVTYSLQHMKPRLSMKAQPGLSVEFEPLDSDEEIVYASPEDELAGSRKLGQPMLTLLVTVNQATQTLTLWHAWYIPEKSLASLMKEKAASKAAKSRRRSSFMSANVGTGATTPAVRPREGLRESFAGTAATRLPGEPTGSQPAAATSRKATRQEEEDAMASQMDPDYHPAASQQTARENRRISSLNADIRQSQHNPNASFAAGGRRNPSFGGPNDRRSFGHRKSRGSTPGSAFSRSLGPDDDLMDMDASFDGDDESVSTILHHIRATFDAAGADSIAAGSVDEMKRELVVRKLHSMPSTLVKGSPTSQRYSVKIVTLRDADVPREDNEQRLNVYIHQQATQDTTCLRLLVKERNLVPESSSSPAVAVPLLIGEIKFGQYESISLLRDHQTHGVLLGQSDIVFGLSETKPWTLPAAMITTPGSTHVRLSERQDDGIRKIPLGPRNRFVARSLRAVQLVLPTRQAQSVTGLWCLAYIQLRDHPHRQARTIVGGEWLAFAAVIFVYCSHLLDRGKRGGSTRSSITAVDKPSQLSRTLQYRDTQHSSNHALDWLIPTGLSKSETGAFNESSDQMLPLASQLATEVLATLSNEKLAEVFIQLSPGDLVKVLLALHIVREEDKLCAMASDAITQDVTGAIIAQVGTLLGLPAWSSSFGHYYYFEGVNETNWSFVKPVTSKAPYLALMDEPVGVYHWFEHAINVQSTERYPTLDVIAMLDSQYPVSVRFQKAALAITPRTTLLSGIIETTHALTAPPAVLVETMVDYDVTREILESLPNGLAAPFREAIARCEKTPPTSWSADLLALVDRDDLIISRSSPEASLEKSSSAGASAPHDLQTACHAIEQQSHTAKTKEASRHAVSQLIFHEDRRLVEATNLMHFNSPQIADCPKQPDWTDTQHFEQQRKITQWVTIRMVALPPGDAMIHFDCQTPLLTDKYHLPGFSSSCLMQPMGHTLMIDRSGLTEEKVGWAYFHAGASAGLRISRNVTGIDTSWIAFNKPNELTNRHAGLLLALGLNGHLKQVAKWLSFKYLTPKHTMTSVGLLLGLSASYMGTMDSLITRMLSVHITRMLPPGAAELNVSPLTQTAGLIGIGLLHYNTQHRRMSEIMLSEVEHMETEDPDSGPDPLRDECYRLAAGIALGYINVGKGKDLRGLHGMHLSERLLAVAMGPRPVSSVHVFDRATAGAVIALTMVYMKSGDRAIAHKIDIPDTEAQFDHVRPDMLMLRAMAKHIILWDSIVAHGDANKKNFILSNLPPCYQSHVKYMDMKTGKRELSSADVPFFNIATGLAWALSLKYAGSGDIHARDEILGLLDYLHRLRGGAEAYYYDAKLAQSTIRRCIDVLALAAATVMAGTGDIRTFRYLRRLHGRTEPEATYGSHLAGHMAIGVLFLGGGTYTLGTSNLAVASLICAFYPLFPEYVHDNRVHLQPLRHFWVFAAEPRCLVVEEIDTHRPIRMPIMVMLKDGSASTLTAPCLLPNLDTIEKIQTRDPSYWQATLDFGGNEEHVAAFRQNQRILVRHCPASEAHNSVFASTLAVLNPRQEIVSPTSHDQMKWQNLLMDISTAGDLDKTDVELILPPNPHSAVHTDDRGTMVDDKLIFKQSVMSDQRDSLWNLRVLFAWAEKARDQETGGLRWLGDEIVQDLKARIDERVRETRA